MNPKIAFEFGIFKVEVLGVSVEEDSEGRVLINGDFPKYQEFWGKYQKAHTREKNKIRLFVGNIGNLVVLVTKSLYDGRVFIHVFTNEDYETFRGKPFYSCGFLRRGDEVDWWDGDLFYKKKTFGVVE